MLSTPCHPAAAAAAGDKALYDAAAGPLDVMGKASFFLGEVGAGANMKLVVNAVMGSMMAAFAEGMSLADRVSVVLWCVFKVRVIQFRHDAGQMWISCWLQLSALVFGVA
jgi:3-hydroxyisobutyrate dehydrogenase-like beta-hydroxyacid dehydrogenase